MKQTIFGVVGATAGAIAWLSFHSSLHLPGLFICVVVAAWAGVGVQGLAFGQLALAGRGGKSPTQYQGATARGIGLLIVAISIFIAATAIR